MKKTLADPIVKAAALAACVFAPALVTQAQHYPAGVEGIKGASLPPPGLYLRDYNYFYWSDRLPSGPPNFEAFIYAQIPRVIWISEFKILGGYYGADILLPFGYSYLQAGPYREGWFGIGDVQVEPITLSWHLKQFDFAVGYAFWAPSGDYDVQHPGRLLPQGHWGNMFTAGGTWYPDAKKTWSVSLLNRYEINQENSDARIKPGDTYTLEVGIGKALKPTVEVGVIGYYQQQINNDVGSGVTGNPDVHRRVLGVGPEVLLTCPKIGVITSIRYAREFAADARPEGNTLNVTFTKRF